MLYLSELGSIMDAFASGPSRPSKPFISRRTTSMPGPAVKRLPSSRQPADQVAPAAPSGLASSNVTATSVQLSWSSSTDTGGSNLADTRSIITPLPKFMDRPGIENPLQISYA